MILKLCGNGLTYFHNRKHPYGRRRVGVNERTGAKMLSKVNMSFCSFMEGQKYKLYWILTVRTLFFEKYHIIVIEF
ncbi:hypothetical protein GGR42_002318 [Saonia flava]|uniref:Uncharacterized protein n=1 Tax=Saonia flava TaxID=523696 RepID=A0A846QS93_9FLAO|nr:hypothetical protein [Saonia flava]